MPFSTYLPEHMGSASLDPAGPFVAGSHAEFTLTYTAGTFGIDDSGMLKISWRTTSDMAKPQFSDPAAPSYTTVEASNGAKLEHWIERLNIRPWVNTLLIRVGRGFLRAGERISVRFGDRRGGSPGLRLQTNCEEHFALKVYVDAFATYEFTELPVSPGFALVPGPAARFKAILPSLAVTGEPFRLAIVAEDVWGNPTAIGDRRLALVSSHPVRNLPETIAAAAGDGPIVLENLIVDSVADVDLRLEHEGSGARPCQPDARRRACPAAALLGRPARAERRDRRHQPGGELFSLCARQGLRRHRRPSGQRLPDHRRVLAGAQPADCGVRRTRPLRVRAGIRMVGQHRHGRRPQHLLPPRRPPNRPLIAHPGGRAG